VTSVLIADDQALVRRGFRLILEIEPDLEVVGEAADGLEAVQAVRKLHPDIVLMDVRMPGMDGLEAAQRIADDDACAGSRVVMLTTFDLDEYVYDALRAGASGFLLKDVQPELLVAGIRAIHAGDALLAPSITRRMISTFVESAPSRRTVSPALGQLSERERETLGLMARGLSNAEIAQRLFISETTVKTHVGHVLTKLGVRDRVQAVIFAYQNRVVTD
jgi:DNA-binding NarL/FixJ family response regulator